MPDTTTAVLALIKPEVGASRDSWGSKTNINWDTLDTYVSQSAPIGMIADFAGPNAPSGWLIADGRLISRVTYSNLFAVIGTYYGAGDGSTTFALPSLNGRSTVGPGTVIDQIGTSTAYALGQKFGNVYNNITQAYLPAYNLVTDYQGTHSHSGVTTTAGPWSAPTDVNGQHTHGDFTGPISADHTHSGVTNFTGEHTHQVLEAGHSGGNIATGSGAGNAAVATSTSGGGAANHQHSFTTGGSSSGHYHQIYGDGSHAHTATVPAHQHGIYADGNHAHNVNLGGGGYPFEVLNPILVVTKIIYAGQQASTRAVLDAAPAPASFADANDEMAAIREELAALKALLMPATRRVISSPSRGPH
jgi:microcystin-dependent protein